MMTIQTFLDTISKTKNIVGYSVISFTGKEYPLLFFSHLFSFFSRNGLLIKRVDVTEMDTAVIKADIATMSFSGQIIYWLYGIHTLTPKKQQEWAEVLCVYNGPHRIVTFFTDDKVMQSLQKNNNSACIAINEQFLVHEAAMVRFLVADTTTPLSSSKIFLARVVPRVSHVSLDNACLLMHYEIVLGKSSDQFFKEWLMHIIEPTHSLFVLSQYFFVKKSKLFFEQWALCDERYMPPFWITYWADQVWRAFVYCELMQNKQYAEAKKVQYKLPFSLINRDWSSLQLTELQRAHHFLAKADFQIKNGGSPVVLELFFTKFFENKFL